MYEHQGKINVNVSRDVTRFIWLRHVDYIKNFESNYNIRPALKRAKWNSKNKARYSTKPIKSKRTQRPYVRRQSSDGGSNRSPMTTDMGDTEQCTASRTSTLDPSFWIHFTSCNILHSGHLFMHFTKNEYESFRPGN